MELQLLDPRTLRPTEAHDPAAVGELIANIKSCGYWICPVLVHPSFLAILDGHHRREAAIRLSLAVIPCFVGSYVEDGIELGAWRPDYLPTPADVLHAASTGRLFPPKTTRHRWRDPGLQFRIPLAFLRGSIVASGVVPRTATPARPRERLPRAG